MRVRVRVGVRIRVTVTGPCTEPRITCVFRTFGCQDIYIIPGIRHIHNARYQTYEQDLDKSQSKKLVR